MNRSRLFATLSITPFTSPVDSARLASLRFAVKPSGRINFVTNQLPNRFQTARLYDDRSRWYLELMLLMPDHLHALIAIDGETSLSKVVGDFKHSTSRFACVQWQRNFFDHRLRHEESADEKAAYIRLNPVRAGFVQNEEDWPYVLDRSGIEMATR